MSVEYYAWLKKHHKNEPYIKGRNFEYRVAKRLRKLGYYVVRKFGSKGHEDLVAVQANNPRYLQPTLLFVQCKWSKKRDTKPEQFNLAGLVKLAENYGGLAVFAGVRKHRMYFQVYQEEIEGGRWVNAKLD